MFLNYVLTGAKIIYSTQIDLLAMKNDPEKIRDCSLAIIIFPQYLMTERQKPVRIQGIESDPRPIQHSSWTQLLNSLQV